ncbi:MAG: SUMF1/EgtB/PvdO family nonheme iron enzyme [Myxococcota bacterium]
MRGPSWAMVATALAAWVLTGCADSAGSTSAPHATSPTASASADRAPSSAAALPSAPHAPRAPSPCPADMVLASGAYCPRVKHRCLRHSRAYESEQRARRRARQSGRERKDRPVVEICEVYREPASCISEARRPLRFCMDRHEWPGKTGIEPTMLVSWTEARAHCRSVGKRLCTADEFNFACEGEEMRPYSYGFIRDAKVCNQDKPYITPNRQLMPHDHCEKSIPCRRERDRIDQREPIGERAQCGSPFGALDLNGNMNEWVVRPDQEAPWRSGLKGGWWGPARSRCRPMVIAHDENYVGYEVGFRCCQDARR